MGGGGGGGGPSPSRYVRAEIASHNYSCQSPSYIELDSEYCGPGGGGPPPSERMEGDGGDRCRSFTPSYSLKEVSDFLQDDVKLRETQNILIPRRLVKNRRVSRSRSRSRSSSIKLDDAASVEMIESLAVSQPMLRNDADREIPDLFHSDRSKVVEDNNEPVILKKKSADALFRSEPTKKDLREAPKPWNFSNNFADRPTAASISSTGFSAFGNFAQSSPSFSNSANSFSFGSSINQSQQQKKQIDLSLFSTQPAAMKMCFQSPPPPPPPPPPPSSSLKSFQPARFCSKITPTTQVDANPKIEQFRTGEKMKKTKKKLVFELDKFMEVQKPESLIKITDRDTLRIYIEKNIQNQIKAFHSKLSNENFKKLFQNVKFKVNNQKNI